MKSQQSTKIRKYRKAVKLTPAEKRALNAFAKDYSTQEEAAEAIGIKVGAYARIKELGRGNSINVDKIRERIKAA